MFKLEAIDSNMARNLRKCIKVREFKVFENKLVTMFLDKRFLAMLNEEGIEVAKEIVKKIYMKKKQV